MANNFSVNIVDSFEETKKRISVLAKNALRESAKVLRKRMKETIARETNSDNLGNHIGSWIFIDKNTGEPRLWFGYLSWQKVKSKNKKLSRASPHWFEYGTKPHTIKAKEKDGKKTLLGYRKNQAGVFFGKYVEHSGNNAMHLLEDTVNASLVEIRQIQEKYIREMGRELEKIGITHDYYKEEEIDD